MTQAPHLHSMQHSSPFCKNGHGDIYHKRPQNDDWTHFQEQLKKSTGSDDKLGALEAANFVCVGGGEGEGKKVTCIIIQDLDSEVPFVDVKPDGWAVQLTFDLLHSVDIPKMCQV